jgi:hypothetical protein
MKQNERQFKIQQLEKQLEAVARMARAYPMNPKYTKRLNYIQNKLMQLKSK